MARVEVLAGPERRRRWSVEQKQAIVAAAFGPGAVVRTWRVGQSDAELDLSLAPGSASGGNGFAQVLMAPAGDGVAAPPPMPAIEIEFAGKARIRIPASISPGWRRLWSKRWRGDDPGS